MIVVFDAKTGQELAGVGIPGGIDDLHYDARRNRLYAACGDGHLTVVERKGDAYEVVAKLAEPKFGRTAAWGGNKPYLGVPKTDGQEPEVRVYEARPVIEPKAKDKGQ